MRQSQDFVWKKFSAKNSFKTIVAGEVVTLFLWVSFLNIITVVLKSGLLSTVLALPPPNPPTPSESYSGSLG